MVEFSYDLIKTNKVERNDENGKKIIELLPQTDITSDELLELLNYVYNLENNEEFKDTILLQLKGLNKNLLIDAFKYSLSREDLKDPIMILNIINLIKIYNNLNDNFFQDENIYISSKADLLDIKKKLKPELKEFVKKVSIYFLSVIKSYNKVTYTSLDTFEILPNIYRTIFLSSDFLTLSGIFSVSEPFNTEECVTIKDSFTYVSAFLTKNLIGLNFMDSFFKNLEQNKPIENKEE